MANEMGDLIVADDNSVLLNLLSETLKERGYVVRTALDGFAALAMMRDRIPDILISDLNMPHMSGFELLSVVRRRYPSIAVIAMSGAYSGAAVPQGIAADAFYAKGSTDVDRLFEILYDIKNCGERQLLRAAAPIWIYGVFIDQGSPTTIAVSCPECLRTFPHSLHDAAFLDTERCCPHCHHPVRLAVVSPSSDVDRSGLGTPAKTVRISAPAYVP